MSGKLAAVMPVAVLIEAAATSATSAALPAGGQKGGGGGSTTGVRVVGEVSSVSPATCSATLTTGTYHDPSAVLRVVSAT